MRKQRLREGKVVMFGFRPQSSDSKAHILAVVPKCVPGKASLLGSHWEVELMSYQGVMHTWGREVLMESTRDSLLAAPKALKPGSTHLYHRSWGTQVEGPCTSFHEVHVELTESPSFSSSCVLLLSLWFFPLTPKCRHSPC